MNAEGLERSVRRLLEYTGSVLDMRRRRPPEPGERFNIFSILNMEADEVNTHCRLLYELLSPGGCHGMGDKFLRDFCETVLRRPCPARVSVSRERSFGGADAEGYGRIDLLIEGEGVCYPIEVKIYAEDQHLQIKRYARFAARARESQVYYLTLDGHEPSAESTGGEDIPNLTCVSFAEDIRTWLARCGELAWQAPSIAGTLRQYIGLIDKLTGREAEDGYMELIQKNIGLSRENFESAVAVSAALEAAKAEKMRQVFREIEAHVSKRLRPSWASYEEDAAAYYGRSRRRVWPGIICPIPHQSCGGLQLAVNIEVEDYLYYGLIFYRDDFRQVPEEVGRLADAFPNQDWKDFIAGFRPRRDWWLWWEYLPKRELQLNFRECRELYPDLYDPDLFREIMSQIFQELDQGIGFALETGLWEAD